MRVLGLAGPLTYPEAQIEPLDGWHDTAAALVCDGEVVAAIEEERLSRDKHTDVGPGRAISFCLARGSTRLSGIDLLATYYREDYLADRLARAGIGLTPRQYIAAAVSAHAGQECDPRRVEFVDHHLCHVWSAAVHSGWDDCLVMSLDGTDKCNNSGLVALYRDGAVTELRRYLTSIDGRSQSLGDFYCEGIRPLGYQIFDEYKVMGLAPHGDPARYAEVFDRIIELLPDGQYSVDLGRLPALLDRFPVRARGAPFRQEHKDYAASLQRALERLVFHIAEHYAQVSGAGRLALAGGVAHNCTVNGLLLASGLFREIFVQPAAHDAGAALGAAFAATRRRGGPLRTAPLSHVYWGGEASSRTIARELERWAPLVTSERVRDIEGRTARFIAEGGVVGWVQGRSEFGPRALGNRSILADPRPASNRDRINAMIKKREGYRPFAPSVLLEALHEIFVVPRTQPELPFMTVVVPVREAYRERLAAITHVDGTARVQSVSREQNPRYWRLLSSFKELSGLGVLLNTSFNSAFEPIVESCLDAIVTLLTTGLDAVVIGDYWVERHPRWRERLDRLTLSFPTHVAVVTERHFDGRRWNQDTVLQLFPGAVRDRPRCPLSPAVGAAARATDGRTTLRTLLQRAGATGPRARERALEELYALWEKRLVVLAPPR